MKKLLLLLGVITFFLSSCGQGEVIESVTPVFTGMSVADENISSKTNLSTITKINESTYNDFDIPKIDIPDQDDLQYYANKNEEIKLNIRLFNPDKQVILRFTLNGVVYQSFEFQDGSNSELIIVKVNSGEISGKKEFTIDEIKYVENVTNDIKDVEFQGDRTVAIGVSYINSIEVNVSQEEIKQFSYNVNVQVEDTENLFEINSNNPIFYLFDGNNIVYSSELVSGNNQISIEELIPSQNYEIAIASTMNLFDGEGNQVIIHKSLEFSTLKMAELVIENVSYNEVQLELINYSNDIEINFETITLISEIETINLTNYPENQTLDGLKSNTDYYFEYKIFYYINEVKYSEVSSFTFTTLEYILNDLYLDLDGINNLGLGMNEGVPEIIAIDGNLNATELRYMTESGNYADYLNNYFPVSLESKGNYIFIKLSEDFLIDTESKYGVKSNYFSDIKYIVVQKDTGKIHQILSSDVDFNNFEELFIRLEKSNRITFQNLDLFYIESGFPFHESNLAVRSNKNGDHLYYLNYDNLVLFRYTDNGFEFKFSNNLNRDISKAFHYFDSVNEVYYYINSTINEYVAYNILKGYINSDINIPSFFLPDSTVLFKNSDNLYYTFTSNGEIVEYKLMNTIPDGYVIGDYGLMFYQFNPLVDGYLISHNKTNHGLLENGPVLKLYVDSQNNIYIEDSTYEVPLLQGIIYFNGYYLGFYESKVYNYDLSSDQFTIIDLDEELRNITELIYDPDIGVVIKGVDLNLENTYFDLESLNKISESLNPYYLVSISY